MRLPTMIFEETIVVDGPFDEVVDELKSALGTQGFGTLTEIDVQDVLHRKIGKEIGRYVIVGACNPTLAARALDVVPQIGVLLPCNVVVREEGEQVIVEAMDPGLMASISGSDDLAPIAGEARELIANALADLSAAG